MLEVRYNKDTKEITGWWGSRFGNKEIKLKNRPSEAIVTLDIGVPETDLTAWLYDKGTKSLIPNPSYTEPKPEWNLYAEVDELEAEVTKIKKGIIRRS